MCRLFSYNGDLSKEDFSETLEQFSTLALNGCVPCGIAAGHLDGWGLHGSTAANEVYARSVSAPQSGELLTTAEALRSGPGQVIAHLRKATIGENQLSNTHPFLRAGISFCHNGSIRSYPADIATKERREGQTDSEIFFLRILERLPKDEYISLEHWQSAVKAEAAEIEMQNNWTSLTCLLKSSAGTVLYYSWNEQHPEAEAMKFADYYTFYIGIKDKATILCSEKLEVEGFEWEKLPNRSFFTISATL